MSRVWLRCTILGLLALSVVIIPASRMTAQQGQATSTDQPNSQVYLGVVTTVNANGTQVQQVVANSPAADAGFLPGDIIMAVDLTQVLSDQPLETILSKYNPGDQVRITVNRSGADKILSVILLSRADAPTSGGIPSVATGAPIAAATSESITIGQVGQAATVSATVQSLMLTPGPVGLGAVATTSTSLPTDNSAANGTVNSATNGPNSVPSNSLIGPVTTGDAINSSLGATITTTPAASATSNILVGTIATSEAVIPIQVSPQPTSSATGAYLGVRVVGEADGLFVAAVQSGSPAASAEIAVADVFVSVDNTPLNTPTDLQTYLNNKKAGDAVTFQLTRAGKTISVPVTLAARPAAASPAVGTIPAAGATPVVPLVSVPLRAEFTQLGFMAMLRPDGLQIVQVALDSPAAQNGLQANDLIVAVNGQNFTADNVSPDFSALLSGQALNITLVRNGQSMQVQIAASNAASTSVSQAPLGVAYTIVTASIASQKTLAVTDGALVTAVTPGSPADTAGIKVGDVITSVDGDKVDAKRTLALRMLPYTTGDTVTLGIQRGTQALTVTVTLASGGSA